MTINRSKYVVHLESATRAPVVPQLATGESQDHGDEQSRVQSATGLDSTFRTGPVERTWRVLRAGAIDEFPLPGCGGKPGDGGKYFLGGGGGSLCRKSASFESIDGSSIDDFPQLTEADLRLITLGIYQPRMARSYYAEHIKTNGRLEIEVCKHVKPLSLTSHGFSVDGRDSMLIRGRIQSRHRCSFRYFIYILIDRKRGGVETVWGYCCSCPNGLRTVGCCSHIATVLWFLGLGQYLPKILIPASFLDDCVESVGQK
jgi:hypothetical protein